MVKLLNKPSFWIILFFLVRLVGITNPPLEIGHSWRQVTGLMVARNFLEVDSSIFFPRVDDNNGATGIIGMEFPLLNYIHFLIAKLFGYTHWYGRLINLLVSSLGVFFFSKLAVKYFDNRVVLASVLVLLTSSWFAFSRKMMPDTFSVSLMLIALYCVVQYFESGKTKHLILYILFSSLGMLSKIPAGVYLPLVFALSLKSDDIKRKISALTFTLVPLLCVWLWYFVWNHHLALTYGNWYNIGKSFTEGFNDVAANMSKVMENFYFNSFNSYVFFTVFIVGCVFMLREKNKALLSVFATVGLLFLVYIFKAGDSFLQSYYILPFVPVMALLAGYGLSNMKKKVLFITVLLFGVSESILNQQHDFFNKQSELYKMELAEITDKVSNPEDLIAINGNGNPQQMYLSYRKGWTTEDHEIVDENFIRNIANKGCRFIFINIHTVQAPEEFRHPVVFSNSNYIVYKIEP